MTNIIITGGEKYLDLQNPKRIMLKYNTWITVYNNYKLYNKYNAFEQCNRKYYKHGVVYTNLIRLSYTWNCTKYQKFC